MLISKSKQQNAALGSTTIETESWSKELDAGANSKKIWHKLQTGMFYLEILIILEHDVQWGLLRA